MALFGALVAALLLAPPQETASEGMKALDAGKPALAEPLLRQEAQAHPGDFTAHFNLALALAMQQKDSEAIDELHKTLDLQPGLYEAELNLAVLLLRNSRANEVVPLLRKALDSPAPSPQKAARASLYLAQALDQTGDEGGAVRQFRNSVELDASAAAAQYGLGRILLKQREFVESEQHLRKAAMLDPGYRDNLLELAGELEKAGMSVQAAAIYKEFPDNPSAKVRLARLLVQNGDVPAAIPALEEAVRSSPSTGNRLALADAYKMNKQADRAVEQLQLAAAADPSNYEVHMFLGRELRDARKLRVAADEFSAAARLRPDSVQAWNELASVSIVNENYAEGLAALDHVRALGKEIPGDLYYRAIALERLNQKKPAMEAYRQFLSTDGGKMPDQEFLARQRIRIIDSELNRR